jgi:hypothetical protein
MLLLGLIAGNHAFADDQDSGKKSDNGAKKDKGSVPQNVQEGLKGAGKGVKKGAAAANKGVQDSSAWVRKKLGTNGGK